MFRGTRSDGHMKYIRFGMPFGIIGTLGVIAGRIIGSPKLEVFAYIPVAVWGAALVAFLVADMLDRRGSRRG